MIFHIVQILYIVGGGKWFYFGTIADNLFSNGRKEIRIGGQFFIGGAVYMHFSDFCWFDGQVLFEFLKNAVLYTPNVFQLLNRIKPAQFIPEVYNPLRQDLSNSVQFFKISSGSGIYFYFIIFMLILSGFII